MHQSEPPPRPSTPCGGSNSSGGSAGAAHKLARNTKVGRHLRRQLGQRERCDGMGEKRLPNLLRSSGCASRLHGGDKPAATPRHHRRRFEPFCAATQPNFWRNSRVKQLRAKSRTPRRSPLAAPLPPLLVHLDNPGCAHAEMDHRSERRSPGEPLEDRVHKRARSGAAGDAEPHAQKVARRAEHLLVSGVAPRDDDEASLYL